MSIEPYPYTVKDLFQLNPTFVVPKYQRGYAWEDEAINDFINDLRKCIRARRDGHVRNHFFGGVVAIPVEAPGSTRQNFQVIDGQQRLASFRMLAALVLREIRKIITDILAIAPLGEPDLQSLNYLEETEREIEAAYSTYTDKINYKVVESPKLQLSTADQDHFTKVISGEKPEPERASHERISAAWDELHGFMQELVSGNESLEETMKMLGTLADDVLGNDCTLIMMVSSSRSEAYQIFQVLNDRGVHLTDGDLLRARTLELLESYVDAQEHTASLWDNILQYDPGEINDNLRWYFASYEGRRPSSSNLADDFLDSRLPCHLNDNFSEDNVEAIKIELERMQDDCNTLHKIGDAYWPYADTPKVKHWDRERLHMLVSHLKHTNAMPLLLAMTLLPPDKFAEGVAIIERFVFRYKTIGNAHISPATSLYHRHAALLRADSAAYSLKQLRQELQGLVDMKVPDSVFKTKLVETRYNPKGTNAALRYLLITLEDYLPWQEKSGQGQPKCLDKSKVFDFKNTTLEHIYPQTLNVEDQDASLEEVKHDLGNLVIFGPEDNAKLANKKFSQKNAAFEKSNVRLNRLVGECKDWTDGDVRERTESLADLAVKTFVP